MPDIDRPAHARDAGFFAAAWPFTGRKGARSRMTPLFQGKIDNFCAAYAVLNAMRLIHGISDLQARALFSELLLSQSRDEKAFRAILSHGTDYVDMVDAFLGQISERFPLRVSAPFDAETACDEVWAALAAYARPEQGRSAVFRAASCGSLDRGSQNGRGRAALFRLQPGARRPVSSDQADHER